MASKLPQWPPPKRNETDETIPSSKKPASSSGPRKHWHDWSSNVQSGITLSTSLRERYSQSVRSRNTRFIKIQISNEELVFVDSINRSGSFSSDFVSVGNLLDDDEPCYVIAFQDSNEPLLFSYIPEGSSVRQKMTYSSSSSSLKALLGENKKEFFGTCKSDFTYEAFQKRSTDDAPLTESEILAKNQSQELAKESYKEMASYSGYNIIARVTNPEKSDKIPDFVIKSAEQADRQRNVDARSEVKIATQRTGDKKTPSVLSRWPPAQS